MLICAGANTGAPKPDRKARACAISTAVTPESETAAALSALVAGSTVSFNSQGEYFEEEITEHNTSAKKSLQKTSIP